MNILEELEARGLVQDVTHPEDLGELCLKGLHSDGRGVRNPNLQNPPEDSVIRAGAPLRRTACLAAKLGTENREFRG